MKFTKNARGEKTRTREKGQITEHLTDIELKNRHFVNRKGKGMEFTIEKFGRVGIFNFIGELTDEHEDNLKLALMKAIHGIDRAILNFQKVTQIDRNCLQLLRQAYLTSVRLRNPLILLNLEKNYMGKISGLTGEVNADFIVGDDNGHDSINKEAAYK